MDCNRIQLNTSFPGLLLLLLFTFVGVTSVGAQGGGGNPSTKYCGAYHTVPPNGGNPDSMIVDRFGNSFDFDDLLVPIPPVDGTFSCNASGYFTPTFYGIVPAAAMPVICQVLADISNIIKGRQGNTECGLLPLQGVTLQVAWIDFSNPDPNVVDQLELDLPLSNTALAIATPFYSNPLDEQCNEVALDRPFVKINGGIPRPLNVFDGRILINSNYLWNFNSSLPTGGFPGQMDLYSALIHEVMHVLGYASRIGINDAYSLWDQTLRVVDNYQSGGGGANPQSILVNPNSCEKNCWEIIPNFTNIAINSCANLLLGPDIVVGDAALAPIAGDPTINPANLDELVNMLSHLSPSCSGQNIDYLMQPTISVNQARRVMTEPEKNIFCALGYLVTTTTGECNGCYAISNQDNILNLNTSCCPKVYYGCFGNPIHISPTELLCNDLSNSDKEIVRLWSLDPNIQITQSGNGWDINFVVPQFGPNNFIAYYTLRGCDDDCRMHNQLFQTRLFIDNCQPCEASDICENILCVDDFENFPHPIGFHPQVWFGYPYWFENYSTLGTPDIIESNNNTYLHLVSSIPNSNSNSETGREAVTLVLQKCIPPDCNLHLALDISKINGNNTPLLEVWGSSQPPCSVLDDPLVAISNNCGIQTTCSNGSIFDPICITSISVTTIGNFISPNLQPAFPNGPFIWSNQTTQDICFLTLVPFQESNHSIAIDNIFATISCEPEIICNDPIPQDVCQGGIANVTFQICAPEIPACLDLTLVTPTVALPPGWTLAGGSPGTFTLTEGLCHTITLQVQVPSNAPIGSMEMIMLSGTATGFCTTVEWGCSVQIIVIDCVPPQVFSCPCAAGGLNIDASENSLYYDSDLGGTPYSALEAAFNYDQNNDGIISQNEHNDCIAILGNLVIDQNVRVASCENVQMQPCAEITVGTNLLHTTLRMDVNIIYSCDIMWHGITVTPHATLLLKGNTIRDAQFAARAEGSSGLGIDPPTKMIASGNVFSNNHVGIFFPGNSFSTVTHLPMAGNTFTSTANLLPPCDVGLFNYSSTLRGFAGVVTNGTPLTVGTPGNSGIVNNFSFIRNGVVSNNAVLNVYRAGIQNINGTPVQYNAFLGNGVVATGGKATVLNCNFNTINTGVYGIRNQSLTVRQNTMNIMRYGVVAQQIRSSDISDNPSIGFAAKGILYRETIHAGGLNSHTIANNTNMFVSQFPGLGPVYYAAIDIDNAMSSDAGTASIKNNHFFSGGNFSDGIRLNGSGGWDIDGNTIDFQNPVSPFFSNQGDGIRLSNTNENYMYQNHINDLDLILRQSIGMSLSVGTGNRYCCNSTFGNKIGSYFFGACGSTEWRVTDMTNHALALSCAAGTAISPQPDYGNDFNATSGTAFHNGGDIEVLNSQFIVLNTQQPHWPVAIATPNVTTAQFFDDGGLDAYCAAPCTAPRYAPAPPDRDIDVSDLTTVYGGYAGGLYGAALQWENERRLYERMSDYGGMIGVNAATDAFYNSTTYAKIGAYYQAEHAAKGIYNYPINIANDLQTSAAQLESNRLAIEAILGELAQAQTSADSALVYQNANAQQQSGQEAAGALFNAQTQAQAFSNLEAFDAYLSTSVLPAVNLLEQNRKTVQRIYLQTMGMGIAQLNAQQLAEAEAIAVQCPLDGGSAVFAARALYHLNVDRVFLDDSICVPVQERKEVHAIHPIGEGLSLVPNPSNEVVTIEGLKQFMDQRVEISLLDITGKVCFNKAIETRDATISTIGLLEGVYICQIKISGNPPVALKLIVVH
jgi:hypothetical protein